MSNQQTKSFLNNLAANVVWSIWGPTVVAFILALWQKGKHGSVDWPIIVLLFLISVVLPFVPLRRRSIGVGADERRKEAVKGVESKLKIHRAIYAAGLPTEVSVREELQNAVRDGLVVTVDNGLGGLLRRDPASGVRKRLEIEYSYGNDKRFIVSRMEYPSGDPAMRLVLPEDTEVTRLERDNSELLSRFLLEKAHLLNDKVNAEKKAQQLEAKLHEITSSLKARTLALCQELRTYVKQLEPKPEYKGGGTPEGTAQWIRESLLPWREKFNAGYMLRFDARLRQIRHELAEKGFRSGAVDFLMSGDVSTQQTLDDAIEALTVMAAKIDD